MIKISASTDITLAELAEALAGSCLALRPDMKGGLVIVRKEYDDSKLPTFKRTRHGETTGTQR